jgi:ADP-ribosylglycohydrolase
MGDPLMVRSALLKFELAQRRESGHDLAGVEEEVRAALEDGAPAAVERARAVLEATPVRADWAYEEPSSLDAILATRPPAPELPGAAIDDDLLRDRLLGAWLGRCAGCNLGKPVEGWTRERIGRYLELADAFPIDDYLPRLDPFPEGLQLNDCWTETTRGNIHAMARDDDLDYTILGLHVLEEHGVGFGPKQIGEEWMHHLPIALTYTAERAAYRNLVAGLRPPVTASFENPYREWIGAQIRADMWGYVAPGDPAEAARLAFADASLSHTANGIYGELWAAALIAIAFVAPDLRAALEASVGFVPARSRLAEALRDVLAMHARGATWTEARDGIEERYGHYSGVHTINNAAVVAAALLWGDGDFSRTIGLAVEGGWDTDCNGATAGSVFGAAFGAGALPAHWVDPLEDRIRTAIIGFDGSRIGDLADRTLAQVRRRREGASS